MKANSERRSPSSTRRALASLGVQPCRLAMRFSRRLLSRGRRMLTTMERVASFTGHLGCNCCKHCNTRCPKRLGWDYGLLERLECRGLFLVNVKHRVEPRHLQQVADVLVEVHQLEIAALVAQRGVVHHQFANARAVDMYYASHVKQNLVVAVAHQLLYHLPQLACGLAQAKLSADVHNGHSVHQSSADLNRHVQSPYGSPAQPPDRVLESFVATRSGIDPHDLSNILCRGTR